MIKAVTTLLLCLLGFVFSLNAQDKFEYGSITYLTRLGKANIQVTTKEGTRKFSIEMYEDVAQTMTKRANDMSRIGWMIYNTSEYNGNGDLYSLTYFIKRKIESSLTSAAASINSKNNAEQNTTTNAIKERKLLFLAENSPVTETEFVEMLIKNECGTCKDVTSLNMVINKLYSLTEQLKRIKVVNDDLNKKYPSVYITLSILDFSLNINRNIDGQFTSANVKLSMQFSQKGANGVINSMPLIIDEQTISALYDNNTSLLNWYLTRLELRLNSFLKSFIAVKGTILSKGETTKNGDIKTIIVRNDNNLDERLKYFGTVYEKGDIQRIGSDLKIGTKLGVCVLKKIDVDNLEFKITDGSDKIKEKLETDKKLEILLDFKD